MGMVRLELIFGPSECPGVEDQHNVAFSKTYPIGPILRSDLPKRV